MSQRSATITAKPADYRRSDVECQELITITLSEPNAGEVMNLCYWPVGSRYRYLVADHTGWDQSYAELAPAQTALFLLLNHWLLGHRLGGRG